MASSDSASRSEDIASSQKHLTSESTPVPSTETEPSTPSAPVQAVKTPVRKTQKTSSSKPEEKGKKKKVTKVEVVPKGKGKGIAIKIKEEKVSPKKEKKSEQTELFASKKQSQKFKDRKVVAGRTINYKAITNAGWDIAPYLTHQKWYHIPLLSDLVYPNLVRAFYANMVIDHQIPSIQSTIKGVTITLHPEGLGKILNIPCVGNTVYNEEDWTNRCRIKEAAVGQSLFAEGEVTPLIKDLKPTARLLHSIVTQTLLPRAGTHERVYMPDRILTYHLMEGIRINLPYMMIRHMIAAVEIVKSTAALPFGMALSRILNHFQVPLTGEEIRTN